VNLRDAARGRDCQIRIPGVCNFNAETTVLCHLSGGGMGAKRSDLAAAVGCSACHAAVDGAVRTEHSKQELALWHLEGVVRTIELWLREGLIRVGRR